MNDPIFILACGGRTGSGWLQRVLTSTGGVLIWGEMGLLSLFADYNRVGFLAGERATGREDDLHRFRAFGPEMWMSNLRPDTDALQHGWRVLMRATLGDAAQNLGYPRWGCKEVWWTIGDYELIRVLWPNAKVILLTRDFWPCYGSAAGMHWLLNRGHHAFIARWLGMSRHVLDLRPSFGPYDRWVRYEDCTPDVLADVLRWCDLPAPSVELSRIGSGQRPLNDREKAVVAPYQTAIDEVRARLGYV